MGLLDGLLNPTKNTNKGYKRAIGDFQNTRQQVDPFYKQFMNTGMDANSALANFFGLNGIGAQQSAFDNYSNGPGFQFMLDKSNRAIDQSAAARGMSQSGAAMKALADNTQGLYNQGLQQHYANLGGMQQGGFAGASGLMDNTNQYGQLQIGKGQAKDQGNQMGAGNVLGMIGTGIGLMGGYGGGGMGGGLKAMLGGGMGGGGMGGGGGSIPNYYGTNQYNPYSIY